MSSCATSTTTLDEDMVLSMGGTEDVNHAEGWYYAGYGQRCRLSPWIITLWGKLG